MSDERKEKWKRQRFLLDKLEEKPSSFDEIKGYYIRNNYKIQDRTIQYDIEQLETLKVIEYDEKTKIYQIAHRKQVFNRAEYDLAMKHCRRLCFTSPEKQRFDHMNPFLAVDLLAFYDIRLPMDVDDKCFVQHLKTGYFKDVYEDLENYRKLMDERGYSKRSSFPKLYSQFADLFSSPTPQGMVSVASTLQNQTVREKQVESEIEAQENHWNLLMREKGKPTSFRVNEKDKKLYDLRALLVGKIYSIVNDLANGIPLQGYCDSCPTMKISIRDKV